MDPEPFMVAHSPQTCGAARDGRVEFSIIANVEAHSAKIEMVAFRNSDDP